jgi:hypothetical protein
MKHITLALLLLCSPCFGDANQTAQNIRRLNKELKLTREMIAITSERIENLRIEIWKASQKHICKAKKEVCPITQFELSRTDLERDLSGHYEDLRVLGNQLTDEINKLSEPTVFAK